MTPEDIAKLPYRPCVGVMLANADGHVFVGQRIDTDAAAWQMPQGGIDEGEDSRDAALRELWEETGVTAEKVAIIGQTAEPLRYDLPDELIGKLWGGKFRGQEQQWFLARFDGSEEDIDLELLDLPELFLIRWVPQNTVADLIVPFKKRVYRAVVEAFRELV